MSARHEREVISSAVIAASRAQEGAKLLLEWTKEGMAEHGWHRAESATGAEPPASGPLPDDDAVRHVMNPGTSRGR